MFAMAISSKCQHCWKIFEIAEGFANQRHLCPYCQQTTLVTPLPMKKKASKRQPITNVQELEGLVKLLLGVVGLLFIIVFFNTISTLAKLAEDDGELARMVQDPPWQSTLSQKIRQLEEKTQQLSQKIESIKTISTEEHSQQLVAIVKPQISSLAKRVENIQQKERRLIKITGVKSKVASLDKENTTPGMSQELKNIEKRINILLRDLKKARQKLKQLQKRRK